MRIPHKTFQKLDRLLALMRGKSGMLIVMQDFPDPDALAAAVALRTLANTKADVPCSLAYGGVVGRAENKALVEYLDLNLRAIRDLDVARFDLIAMVDTQPGTGNNSLPTGVMPHIVLDHHPFRHATRAALFTDIRGRYGATSTILYEYLAAARIAIEPPLATALVYGIFSDTQNLGRQTIRPDIEAYAALYPLANRRMLTEIQSRRLPQAYFHLLVRGIARARLHGTRVVSPLGATDNPDMIGEIADLLLRKEGAVWALCHGVFQNRLLLSLRAADPDANAGRLIRAVIGKYGTGGGHDTYAGGQIDLSTLTPRECRFLEHVLLRRFLTLTGGRDEPAVPLVLPFADPPAAPGTP